MTQDEEWLREFRSAVAVDLLDLAALHDREVDAGDLERLRATAGEGGLLRLRLSTRTAVPRCSCSTRR
jgi:hypothetical protein